MQGVGPTLGDQCNLCTGTSSLIRIVVSGRNTKFLYRIERYRQHRRECCSTLVVHRYSINRHVALVAARAIDGPFSSVKPRNVVSVVWIGDSRLQREKLW